MADRILPELRFLPAVFAVGEHYQILTWARSELLLGVEVNGVRYFDHSGGIVRSMNRLHRVQVPARELDRAGTYTVFYRRIIDRKPYFTTTEEPVSAAFRFRPVRAGEPVHIYHLSDAHGSFTLPSGAGSYFGADLNLLILNGDIVDSSDRIGHFELIFRLCEALTRGELPCVFSRGNHDLRGQYAECLAEYTPTRHGLPYYTFRLGPLWGLVLDCGEDKEDGNGEYGHTVACHAFRLEEGAFLEEVVRNADREYLAPGVEYRLIVSHVPIFHRNIPPFDIEQELYMGWLRCVREHIRPHLWLSGHLHTLQMEEPGGALDSYGLQPCPAMVSGYAVSDAGGRHVDFVGSAVTLDGNRMECSFTDSHHNARTTRVFFKNS